jgi:hypothetical protein
MRSLLYVILCGTLSALSVASERVALVIDNTNDVEAPPVNSANDTRAIDKRPPELGRGVQA